MTEWTKGLTHKDWLFDGSPIRGRVMLARFANLDWSKAWIDFGPSVAGNPGPYWHVPLRETVIDGQLYDCGDTVHRLYPKVLQSKWQPLIQRACEEVAARALSRQGAVKSDIPPDVIGPPESNSTGRFMKPTLVR